MEEIFVSGFSNRDEKWSCWKQKIQKEMYKMKTVQSNLTSFFVPGADLEHCHWPPPCSTTYPIPFASTPNRTVHLHTKVWTKKGKWKIEGEFLFYVQNQHNQHNPQSTQSTQSTRHPVPRTFQDLFQFVLVGFVGSRALQPLLLLFFAFPVHSMKHVFCMHGGRRILSQSSSSSLHTVSTITWKSNQIEKNVSLDHTRHCIQT